MALALLCVNIFSVNGSGRSNYTSSSVYTLGSSSSPELRLPVPVIIWYIYIKCPPIIRTECECQLDSPKCMYLNGLCSTSNGLWLVGWLVGLFICITGAEARGFYYEAGCSVDLTVWCRVLFFFFSSLFFYFFNVSIQVGDARETHSYRNRDTSDVFTAVRRRRCIFAETESEASSCSTACLLCLRCNPIFGPWELI